MNGAALRPFHQASLSIASMGGGIALAAIPAATLSISSHTFTTAQQGVISVVLTASTFVSQLVAAAIVEARLGTPGAERRVAVPSWLALTGIIAAVILAFLPSNAIALCVTLPFLLSTLEVGRSVAVAERLDLREIVSAALIGVGALGGLCAAYLGARWGMAPLAVGIATATVMRAIGTPRAGDRPPFGTVFWVVTDVGITGVVYPLLNSLILALIGPVGSVLFAAISTVSGLLAIPLNFMRLRLLKAHSRLDIGVSVGAVLLCTIVIGVLEFTGVLGFVFAGPWRFAITAIPLATACLWRAASIASTLPFASLRRLGRVRLLTVLRGICGVATFAAGAVVLPLHDLTAVFGVLLLGELAQAIVYELARRRITPQRENPA